MYVDNKNLTTRRNNVQRHQPETWEQNVDKIKPNGLHNNNKRNWNAAEVDASLWTPAEDHIIFLAIPFFKPNFSQWQIQQLLVIFGQQLSP